MSCYREISLSALKEYMADYRGNFWSKPPPDASLDEKISYAQHSRGTRLATYAIEFLSSAAQNTPATADGLGKMAHAYHLLRSGSVRLPLRNYRHMAHSAILFTVLSADTVPSLYKAGRFKRFAFPADLRLDTPLREGVSGLDTDDITYGNLFINCMRADLERFDHRLSHPRNYSHIADPDEREHRLRHEIEYCRRRAWLGHKALAYISKKKVRAMELDNAIGRVLHAISNLQHERSVPDVLEDWIGHWSAVEAGVCFASVYDTKWPTVNSEETTRFIRFKTPDFKTNC